MTNLTDYDGDLFDAIPEVAAARLARRTAPLVDALTCLRDVVPDAVQCIVELRDWHRTDERGSHRSGEWAYSVTHAGLRWEGLDTWRSFEARPARLLTWNALTELTAHDRRRAGVVAWAASLDAPDAWRDLTRPYELWPEPETWHPDYIKGDRARAGCADRMDAWRTVRDMLSDAIARIEQGGRPAN